MFSKNKFFSPTKKKVFNTSNKLVCLFLNVLYAYLLEFNSLKNFKYTTRGHASYLRVSGLVLQKYYENYLKSLLAFLAKKRKRIACLLIFFIIIER